MKRKGYKYRCLGLIKPAKRVFKSCNGQLCVILTLMMPAVIGALILGADVTIRYCCWAQLQMGANAAVLAGAIYLPSSPRLAVTAANSFARLNGVKAAEIISTRVAIDKMSITMSASRSVPHFFGRALGFDNESVMAAATARIEVSGSTNRSLPTGIRRASLSEHDY
jgi:hypothetical protein